MIAWLGMGLLLAAAARWRSANNAKRRARDAQAQQQQDADRLARERRDRQIWKNKARRRQAQLDAAPIGPIDPEEVWEVTQDCRTQRQLQTQHESRRAKAELPMRRKEPALVAAARELQQRVDELEAQVSEEHARRERRRTRRRTVRDDNVDMFGAALAAGSYLASCDWGSSGSSSSGADNTSGGGGSFGGGGATVSFDD